MNLQLTKLTIAHFYDFYAHARERDLLEWELGTNEKFSNTLMSDLANADCLIDKDTNEVFAIGGIDGDVIWALCTYRVEEHPIPFLRACGRIKKQWVKWQVHNCVWLGNELHVKWLKFIGATFGKTIQINNEKFQHFILKE